MILLISNERDATARFFEQRLSAAGARYCRLNTERLSRYRVDFRVGREGISSIHAEGGDQSIHLDEITAIYYRRPRQPEIDEDVPEHLRPWVQSELRKLWGGLLNVCPARMWVNHPTAISSANYKPEQLVRAAGMGLDVPTTQITNDRRSAEQFCENLDWEVVAKPIGHGYVRGEDARQSGLIYTNRIDRDQRSKLASVALCPTLLQAYIEKAFDVRVTVVGEECIAVRLDSQASKVSRVDCRRDNMAGMRYAPVELPAQLRSGLLQLTGSYGLCFAAIDLALDHDDRYWFLELNPAGQWAWLEEQAGAPISQALIHALTNP